MELFFIGCDSTSEPTADGRLSGVVYDPSGVTLENAVIEIGYRFESGLPKCGHHVLQTAISPIRFAIPGEDQVKLWISNYVKNDTVIILIDKVIKPGY